MITFDEAKKVALSLVPGADVCDEYKKAYHFLNSQVEAEGGFNDVVVMKEDGRTRTFVQFLLDSNPENNPKRIILYRND